VNDLCRSPLTQALVGLGCRALSRSPVVHVDGPRSARAAWTVAELRELADRARAGRRVLLVDKQRFPRPKVCGCCLNAAALATLRRVGVGPRLDALRPHAIDRLVMRAGARAASLRLPGGLSLSRPALDGMLVDAAVDAGATFCDGVSARVAPPAGNAGGHHVALNTDIVRARCVVVADGLAGTALRDWPSMASAARPDARVGLGVHLPAGHALTAQLQANAITMLCGRRGYLGMVRLEHGGIDVAAAADRDALKDHGGAAPLAQAIAADAQVSFDDAEAWPWRLTPPLTRSRSRLAGPGLFVVGDAAGYVEPFTGEGMAWAWPAAPRLCPTPTRRWTRGTLPVGRRGRGPTGAPSPGASAAAARWPRCCAGRG